MATFTEQDGTIVTFSQWQHCDETLWDDSLTVWDDGATKWDVGVLCQSYNEETGDSKSFSDQNGNSPTYNEQDGSTVVYT